MQVAHLLGGGKIDVSSYSLSKIDLVWFPNDARRNTLTLARPVDVPSSHLVWSDLLLRSGFCFLLIRAVGRV